MGNALKTRSDTNGESILIFENYEPNPKVSINNLIEEKSQLAATTVGDYAIFAGGFSISDGVHYSSAANVYSNNLTKSTLELSEGRSDLAATTVGVYALFGGGVIYGDSSISAHRKTVEFFNNKLVRGNAPELDEGRNSLPATTVGRYALFGGGYTGNRTSRVDAYNTSLTKTSVSSLSEQKSTYAATSNGNYALFGGGYTNGSQSNVVTVDAYNLNLVKTTAPSLSRGRSGLAATAINSYALFGGGTGPNGPYQNALDVYSANLTRTTAPELRVARCYLAATTNNDYAFFGGGRIGEDFHSLSSISPTVDVYSSNLTRDSVPDLDLGRDYLAAASVGCYSIFGGGTTYGSEGTKYCATVDAYTLAPFKLTLYKNSIYKFQDMYAEVTVEADIETKTIATPATGYIKLKKATLS